MSDKSLIFGRISNIFVAGLPVLAFLYFLWFLISWDLYFPTRSTISCVWGVVLLLGTILYIPAQVFAHIRYLYRIPLFILFLASFCLSSFLALLNPTIQNTAKLGNYTYHLIAYDNFADAKIMHYLVKCYGESVYCNTVSPTFNVSGASIWPTQLVVDDENNELHVFIRGWWVFTYGQTTREYHQEGTDRVGEDFYDLYSYAIEDTKYYRMATCDRETKVDCELLPFTHATHRDVFGDVVSATDTGELWILFDGQLLYDYFNQGQEYSLLAEATSKNSIASAPISSHERYNGEFFTAYALKDNADFRYLLFACTYQNQFCRLLPLRYATKDLGKVRLSLDPAQTQLQFYVNNQLVYTYSQWNVSSCHLQDCRLHDE